MCANTMVMRLSLVAGLIQVCYASFDANRSSYINVQVPVHVHEHNISGGLIHRTAQFGKHFDLWQNEGHIAALTHYVHGPLCSMPNASITKEFGQSPFFLMADMGGCTPVSKARRAQELGAAGLVLSSHYCLCSENCTNATQCLDELPPVTDDGSGGTVQIPTMMISRGKAMRIQEILHENHVVLMEMAWHMPKMEKAVPVDIWYSPNSQVAEEFLSNFSALALVLKEYLTFRPHHYILDGNHMQCEGQVDDPQQSCYSMCTNNGRYCAVSHGYNHRGVTGNATVTESLRRMCLLKHHSTDGFWTYISHFKTLCDNAEYFSNNDCVKDAMKHSNIDENVIEECMNDSGDIHTDATNQILEQAMQASGQIVETPTIHINGLPFRGPLSTKLVFEFYCLGFQNGKAPHVCSKCGFCGDPVACASRTPMHCAANDGEIPESKKASPKGKKKGRGFGHFVLITFILTGAGGYIYYKKYMEDDDRPSYTGYSLGAALMSDTD